MSFKFEAIFLKKFGRVKFRQTVMPLNTVPVLFISYYYSVKSVFKHILYKWPLSLMNDVLALLPAHQLLRQ
jgi:hypothetical protein